MTAKPLQRHDGSISRTQVLNAISAFCAFVLAGLPILEIHLPPLVYSLLLLLFGGINAGLRRTQTRL